MDFLSLVAKLTLDSSQYESGLGKAKGLASTLGNGIKTGLKVAGTAIAGATTALAGFGAISVKTGMDFDKSMSQVAATMGLSMDEMKNQVGSVDTAWGKFTGNLRDYAQFMGSNTAFSATEAADALNYMALAGYDAQTSMQMLPNVLNLAAAGSMDLARASDMVTDTQTAFGISLERTSQMVDEMAKAASTGNTSVEQLGDAFLTVGGLAQELNGGMVILSDGTTAAYDNVQELEIALTAMANAGIKGSEAGTHMRNMLLKLSSPTDDGAAAFEALGVSVFDSEGRMRSLATIMEELDAGLSQLTQEEKLQAISDIFNTRDTAAAEALLNAVGDDWAGIAESILDADGAAQKMADTQLDNLAGDTTLFKSALEGAQIAVSDELTPSLRDFVQLGTQGLSDMTKALKEGGLEGAMSAFGETLSNGLNLVIEKLPDAVDAGTKLLEALGQGIIDNAPTLFNAFMEISGQLTEKALELMQTVAEGLSDFDWGATIQQMVDFMVQTLTGGTTGKFLEAGFSIMESLLTGIIQSVPIVARGAIDIIHALTEGIQQNLPQMIPTAMNTLMEFSGTLRENVGELVSAGLDMLLSIADGIIQNLPVLIETIPTIVTNIAGIINDNAPKLLVAGIELIGKLVIGIVRAIPTIIAEFPKIIQAIVSVIMAFNWINLGTKIITGIVNGIKSLATKIPTAMKNIGTQAIQWLQTMQWSTLGKDIIDLIVIGVKSLASLVPNALKAIGTAAINLFKNIDWKSLGIFLVEGIWAGISGSLQWIKDRITGWVGDVLSFIKGLFKIESPSKVMRDEVGIMLGRGVAVGIEKSLPYIEDAMSDMTDLVEEPDISASLDITKNGVSNNSSNSQFKESQKINALAEAIVDAFVKADIGVDIDGREFGRLVRKAVTA